MKIQNLRIVLLFLWIGMSVWEGKGADPFPRDSLLAVWQDELQEDTNRMNAIFWYINTYHEQKNPDSVTFYAEKLEAFAVSVNNLPYQAQAKKIKGNNAIFTQRIDDALRLLNESLAIWTQIGDLNEVALTQNSLAIAYYFSGQPDKTIAALHDAIETRYELGDTAHTAGIFSNLANIYEGKGEADSALALRERALEICETYGQSPFEANIRYNLANTYRRKGDYKAELVQRTASLKLYQAKQDTAGMLRVLFNLAQLYEINEDPKQARVYLEEATTLATHSPNSTRRAEVFNSWGNHYLALTEFQQALDSYHQTLDILQENQIPFPVGELYNNLSIVYLELGKLNEAGEFSEKAFTSQIDKGEISTQTAVSRYEVATRIYIEKYEWDEARSYALEGIKRAEERGYLDTHMKLAHHLVRIQKHFGNTAEALRYVEIEVALKDSLDREENSRALIRQEYKYSYEQQALADSLRNAAQLALQASDLRRRTQTNWLLLGILALLATFGALLYNRFRLTRQQKQLIEEEKGKLDKAYSELNTANEKLKELDDFKSHFFTNISHEFRTPLTVIDGMAKQVRKQPERWLDKGTHLIERNAGSLLHLINQILDLRKLESKKLQLTLVQDDIVKFSRFQVGAFESLAESRDIALEFQSEYPELSMDFDPEKLGQIQRNLLSNALKFTPAGGQVKLELLNAGSQHLRLRVSDTGIGIPAEKVSRIFDRFYQVNASDTREGEGTGIGLSLTMELVHLMKGSIEVNSEEGKGSVFEVTLPIQQQAIQQNVPVPATLPPGLELPLAAVSEVEVNGKQDRPRLLIIEDNPDIVQYLTACLEGQYELSSAPDGQAGIDMALAQIPDIIISDVMMPHKNGYEVCDILKQDLRTSHIPILLLTAKADQPSRLEGYKRGADAYLPKPFDQEELLIRLDNLLQTRKLLQARYASTTAPVPSEKEEVQVEDAFVAKIRESILENLDDPEFGIEALYPLMGMSRTSFYRKVKALTGSSASHFIRAVRVEQAKALLKQHPDMQIAEVGYATGFGDPSYFGRVFKEVAGIAPGDFREA